MKKVTKNIPSDNNVYPRVDLTDSNITLFEETPVNYITINQNLTDPAQMISGDIKGDQIQWIRDNSHRVLGKKTADGVMTICELSDTNSNNYFDGTPANLDGSEGDVFMRLPEFYYSAEETETDIWKIGFSSKNFAGSKKWDSNVLIGAYEAYYDNTKLRSISGVESSGNISQEDFIQHSRSRGTGYMIVDWTMHCMMAFLFFAYYGNTNSQRICGAGTNSYEKQTGGTNSLGMTDTEGGIISTQQDEGGGENSSWDTSKNGNQGSINFWGLENWWGNKNEWIEGIEWTTEGEGVGNYTLVGNVTNLDGSTRKVTCPDPASYDMSSGCLYPTKFTIGEYLDLIPKAGLTQQEASDIGYNYTSDFNYGYSDGCAVLDLAGIKNQPTEATGIETPELVSCVVCRSCDVAYSDGGVSCSNTAGVSSVASPSVGSRLAFKGEVRRAASVSEFKSASAID